MTENGSSQESNSINVPSAIAKATGTDAFHRGLPIAPLSEKRPLWQGLPYRAFAMAVQLLLPATLAYTRLLQEKETQIKGQRESEPVQIAKSLAIGLVDVGANFLAITAASTTGNVGAGVAVKALTNPLSTFAVEVLQKRLLPEAHRRPVKEQGIKFKSGAGNTIAYYAQNDALGRIRRPERRGRR